MTTKQTSTISWLAGILKKEPLAGSLHKLEEKHGDAIVFSYLEWRPGAGLLNPDAGPAPVLFQGAPSHDADVALDEVRLFSEKSGLHAIEDSGGTRWMQWRHETSAGADWTELQVDIVEYSVLMLDERSARRFGLAAELPDQEKPLIREYRLGGEIFTWNLLRGGSE